MDFDNRIDPINTTISFPPGAWSAPYKYSIYETLPNELWETQDPSPACEIATTAGDHQIQWCKPGKPNCPMSRELEPTQHVNGDISYCNRDGDVFGNNFKILNKGPYSKEYEKPCKKKRHGPRCMCSKCMTKKHRGTRCMTNKQPNLLLNIMLVLLIIFAFVKLASTL